MGDMGPPPSYNLPSASKPTNPFADPNPNTYRQPTSSLHNTSHLYSSSSTHSQSYSPAPDFKDPYSTPQQYAARKHRRRKTCCIAFIIIAVLMALTVGLTVAGAVFHWGNSRYCVRWGDGTTSGDCHRRSVVG